jgi:hypothetical protein
MAQVNVVDKKVQMGLDDIIRFQLITHCSINNIVLSDLELECLVSLGLSGPTEQTDFCNDMADKRLAEKLKTWKINPDKAKEKQPESSPQTIRNVLIKIEREKLLLKEGRGRKKISLNPDLKIQTTGNILLNYKFIHVESQKA